MSKPLHICIFTSAHALDDMRVRHKVAASFVAQGYRVTWAGCNRSLFDRRACLGEGIEFNLVAPKSRRLGRLVSLFQLTAMIRSMPKIDIFYAPELDTAMLILALRVLTRGRARLVFDVHESYDTYMIENFLGGRYFPLLSWIVRKCMKIACSRADLVMSVSNGVMEPYRSICKESIIVRSCAPKWFAGGPAAKVGENSVFVIMHGKSDLERCTLRIIEALGLIVSEVPHVRVMMIDRFGDSGCADRRRFWEYVDSLGVRSMIDLRPGVPMKEMPVLLSQCDAGMVAYNRRMGAVSLANRPFEYMAVGLPMIAPIYACEIAKIVKEEQCGVLADFEHAESIAEGILQLVRDPIKARQMGQRAREAFLERHNWEEEIKLLFARIARWTSC